MAYLVVRYPHTEPLSEPMVCEYVEGMRRGTITDMNGYDRLLASLQRTHNKRAVDEEAKKRPDTILVMSEYGAVGVGLLWTVLVPTIAVVDDELMLWHDPYRMAVDMLDAREAKDYARSDMIRSVLTNDWKARVMIAAGGIRVTTAE